MTAVTWWAGMVKLCRRGPLPQKARIGIVRNLVEYNRIHVNKASSSKDSYPHIQLRAARASLSSCEKGTPSLVPLIAHPLGRFLLVSVLNQAAALHHEGYGQPS